MPTLIQDIISEEASIIEEAGAIRSAVRTSIVKMNKLGNYGIGAYLVAALSTAPVAGSVLDISLPHVRVLRRIPEIVGLDADSVTVRVRVEYEAQYPTPMTVADVETPEAIPIRGGASLVQIDSEVDRDDNPVQVQYHDRIFRTKISVYDFRGNVSLPYIEATRTPDSIVSSWINCVNSAPWRSASEHQWLCTTVSYELKDQQSDPPRYAFTYEFERNPHEHKYTVVYEDENGDIPADVDDVPGAIRTFVWHPERDFRQKFGV